MVCIYYFIKHEKLEDRCIILLYCDHVSLSQLIFMIITVFNLFSDKETWWSTKLTDPQILAAIITGAFGIIGAVIAAYIHVVSWYYTQVNVYIVNLVYMYYDIKHKFVWGMLAKNLLCFLGPWLKKNFKVVVTLLLACCGLIVLLLCIVPPFLSSSRSKISSITMIIIINYV